MVGLSHKPQPVIHPQACLSAADSDRHPLGRQPRIVLRVPSQPESIYSLYCCTLAHPPPHPVLPFFIFIVLSSCLAFAVLSQQTTRQQWRFNLITI
uniref:Uncharacterized protein n=1 Tax=Nelumbo nucifera TaxID=4432 RepID=A0A822YH58_NELNU|nr:TPA_asm: hypothetical protein HUJ06_012375 [Nelumbo nucifera]